MEKIKLNSICLRVPNKIKVFDKNNGVEAVMEVYVNEVRFYSHVWKKTIEELGCVEIVQKLFNDIVNGIVYHIDLNEEELKFICDSIHSSYIKKGV